MISRKIASISELFVVALVVLKLINEIDWSWWLVTAPLWGGYLMIGLGFTTSNLMKQRKVKKKEGVQLNKPERKKSIFQERLDKMAKERSL